MSVELKERAAALKMFEAGVEASSLDAAREHICAFSGDLIWAWSEGDTGRDFSHMAKPLGIKLERLLNLLGKKPGGAELDKSALVEHFVYKIEEATGEVIDSHWADEFVGQAMGRGLGLPNEKKKEATQARVRRSFDQLASQGTTAA